MNKFVRDGVELETFPNHFLKSFLIVFKRTIGQYDLGKSYIDLLDLGIMTIVDDLK